MEILFSKANRGKYVFNFGLNMFFASSTLPLTGITGCSMYFILDSISLILGIAASAIVVHQNRRNERILAEQMWQMLIVFLSFIASSLGLAVPILYYIYGGAQ